MGLSVAGWLVALYSLWHREGLFTEGLLQKSFCNVNAAFNCDTVALSSYSSIGGFPTAALGMFFSSVVAILAVQAYFASSDGRTKDATQSSSILLLVCLFSLVPTAIFAFVSMTVLKTLCLMCFVTYIVNVGLAVFALRAWSTRPEPSSGVASAFSPIPQKALLTALIMAALHSLAPAMVRSSFGQGVTDSFIDTVVAKHLQEAPKNLRTEGFPSKGTKDATVTVVEFSDFQCPHCARAALTLPELVHTYGGKVRLVHKNFPLDSACNPHMKAAAHPFACVAAKTGRCVHQKKGDEAFYAYANEVFSNQSKISDAFLKSAAAKQGLEGAELEACVQDYATHQAVVEEAEEGKAAGVQGTPTIYVNGRLVEYGVMPKIMKRVLDLYVSKK